MSTFTFQPGYTWRKAGFLTYSDSLSYRDVLEANPEWDITSLPPPGSILNGGIPPARSGLSMAPMTSGYGNYSNVNPETYFPFNSREEYILSTIKYSPSALKRVEECNGYSQTSTKVLTEDGLG